MNEKKLFSKKFWGYKQDEVEEFIAKILFDRENELKALEKEHTHLKENIRKLEEKIVKLEKELSKHYVKEKALSDALIQAQLQAAAIEEKAEKKAEEIKNAARAEVEIKKLELKNLQNQHVLARNEFKLLLEKYLNIVNELDISFNGSPESDNLPEDGDRQIFGREEEWEEEKDILNDFQDDLQDEGTIFESEKNILGNEGNETSFGFTDREEAS